jgi:SAM-dependent methyltransferase
MLRCPVCARTDAAPLLDLGTAAVFCNVQWATRDEALRTAQGPIELAACRHCGHAFNGAFDPELVAYAPGYENSQHASTVFSGYAEQLVERLVSTYALEGRAIVDIGCGRGDLLRMLTRRADGRGFGFDPSFKDADLIPKDPAVEIVNEYFDAARAAETRPALVCCRHVLEHVSDPVVFLRGMRDALAAAGDSVLYLEVPNGAHLFKTGGVWDVLYEHYSYFTAHSLELALRKAGFDVLKIYPDFGDQFLCVDARVARTDDGTLTVLEARSQALPQDGVRRMSERIAHWQGWATDPQRRERRATVWGAGSKGVMFLNLIGLKADGVITTVIDQNAAKQGRFVSGTGQQIVLPSVDALRGIADVVLMNSIYAGEVEGRIRGLGSDATLLFADR